MLSPLLTLIQYTDPGYYMEEQLSPEQASDLVKKDFVNWIDVEITNQFLVKETSQLFNIHHLIAEDILNVIQLPKFELFENHLFFTTKMLSYDDEQGEILEEHLSVVMTKDLLITFQEGLPGDAFNELRDRIKLAKGLIRKYGADYLFYHILDAVVDHYMVIMEKLRSRIEQLENKSLKNPSLDVMSQVLDIKKDINILRKYTIPMRDALNKMRVEADHFIDKTSVNYFQDVADHLNYLVSSFDTSREMLRDLMDLHHSNQNNEMNRVMKTLTVVSAIFIPLTFLAGVYGMNFDNMPELHSTWGYPMIIMIMCFVAIMMAIYMRLKRWF